MAFCTFPRLAMGAGAGICIDSKDAIGGAAEYA
eukprot:CAMPEP_0197054868 /NCGR_PEP_ID=MMETSP1384-20130603/52501_1 /TAXON_ID=29189 /ORGANISM="Ammonia sp." /LENGTH=32 /DNA_ID= /DNA_START= /DNA_END= /DNA_ORIENTATION=